MIEVAPTHCVIEISKSTGDLRVYHKVRKHPLSLSLMCKHVNLVTNFNFNYQFCESLSNLLKQKPDVPSQSQDSVDLCAAERKKQDAGW